MTGMDGARPQWGRWSHSSVVTICFRVSVWTAPRLSCRHRKSLRIIDIARGRYGALGQVFFIPDDDVGAVRVAVGRLGCKGTRPAAGEPGRAAVRVAVGRLGCKSLPRVRLGAVRRGAFAQAPCEGWANSRPLRNSGGTLPRWWRVVSRRAANRHPQLSADPRHPWTPPRPRALRFSGRPAPRPPRGGWQRC